MTLVSTRYIDKIADLELDLPHRSGRTIGNIPRFDPGRHQKTGERRNMGHLLPLGEAYNNPFAPAVPRND
ncbi:MAG: hypothetical protein JWM91_484 [Rhodospirillales bacterium]|nr:hypothetical protein [Rhodospirillales bacterium]